MAYRIIFAITALFCQVKSQLCVTPSAVPQIVANSPLTAPQVLTTPIVASTIVDNSVSTALANALQLLIISDIIETKLGGSCLNNWFNLNPIESPCCGNRIEVIQPIAEYITSIAPCASPVEVIAPCRSVIEPYPYLGGCNEFIGCNPCCNVNSNCNPCCNVNSNCNPCCNVNPNCNPCCNVNQNCNPCCNQCCNPCCTEIVSSCLPNVCRQDIITANRNYYNVADFLTQNFNPCGCGVDVIAPVCGTEICIPPCNNGCYRCYNELVTSIPYNSCGDIIPPCNPCGVEVNSPCGQYYGGIPEVVSPISSCNCGCYGNIPECFNPCNNFGGITEFISSFNPGCGVTEIVTPCRQYYGGFPEVISPVYKPGCAGIPELLPTNPYGPCCEIVPPCSNFPEVIIQNPCNTCCSGCDFCGTSFAPNFYGVGNPSSSCSPVVAELLIPPSIPAQLNCNFGYSPTLGPCLNMNVEPLPYGPGFCY